MPSIEGAFVVRKPAQFLLCLIAMLPVSAMALGLGSIKLNSALNQPLDAEIELISATTAELDSLSISLASADAFASYGLDRPGYLLGMQFRIVRDGSGGAIVRVSTADPVREPFVTFLLEADWSRGRLLREYTVLLDPPVFMTEQATPATRPAAPAVTQPSTGAVTRVPAAEPSPPPPSAQPPVRSAPRSDALSVRYGPVRRNETLWTIASRLRPERSISINQMMIALFRENPEAFMGNINRLRQGAVLRVPSTSDIYALSTDAAFAEVRRQNAAWRASRPAQPAARPAADTAATARAGQTGQGGRLRLVPPGDAAREQAGRDERARDAAADSELAGNAALTARIRSLEGELENARRLIDVKESELAALQSRLESLEARLADQEATAEAVVDEQPDVEAVVDDTAAEVVEPPVAEVTEPVTAEPEPAEAVTPPPVVVSPPVESKGLISRVVDVLAGAWIWILGILGIGLLGVFGWMMRRRASDEDYAESWETGEWKAPEAEAAPAVPASEPDTESQPAPQFDRDESFVVVEAEDTIAEEALKPDAEAEPDEFAAALGDAFEDTGTFTPGELEVEKAEQVETLAGDDEAEYPFEDTMIGHDALKLDESDPVAEADFHMAYGLYDQAAALVERAAEKEPERRDLKMKLLEIFFVWGNKERFLEEAQGFKSDVGDAGAGDWEKVVIMGKQLCPDEDIFVSTESTGVFDAPDLEFSLDDDEAGTVTDLDVLGDADSTDDAGLDALKEQVENQLEPSEETLDLGSTHLDMDLGFDSDAETELEGTDLSAALPEGDSPEVSAAGGLDEDLEIDLDFQFEDVSDEEPTAVMEDVSEEDVAGALQDDDETRVEDLSGAGTATGSDETLLAESADFDPFGAGDDMTVETPQAESDDHGATMQMPKVDLDEIDISDATAQMQAMDEDATRQIESAPADLAGDETVQISREDFAGDDDATARVEFGDMEGDMTTQLPAAGANGEDLDDEEEESTQKLQALDLPEGEQLDEVGTKLDLARAFVDMGDPDGARNILHEVLDEGNDSQKQEAQSLLDNLG